MKKIFLVLILFLIVSPQAVFARRVSVDDKYQASRDEFNNQLQKLSIEKREKVKQADSMLNEVNQKVSSRFDEDVAKLSAILEEVKERGNVTKTTVAYGQGDSKLDSAAYWVNYAAEAVAYQKIQDYTPQISGDSGASNAVLNRINKLSGDLGVLRGKVLKAKNELALVLKYVK